MAVCYLVFALCLLLVVRCIVVCLCRMLLLVVGLMVRCSVFVGCGAVGLVVVGCCLLVMGYWGCWLFVYWAAYKGVFRGLDLF